MRAVVRYVVLPVKDYNRFGLKEVHRQLHGGLCLPSAYKFSTLGSLLLGVRHVSRLPHAMVHAAAGATA